MKILCPKVVEHNSSLLKCGLCMLTPFQSTIWKGGRERETLKWKNLTNTTSAMWSKSISTVISHVDSMYFWYNVMRKAFFLCSILLKIVQPQSNHEKYQTNPNKRHSMKHLASIPPNYEGYKKQGKCEKIWHPRRLQQTAYTWGTA